MESQQKIFAYLFLVLCINISSVQCRSDDDISYETVTDCQVRDKPIKHSSSEFVALSKNVDIANVGLIDRYNINWLKLALNKSEYYAKKSCLKSLDHSASACGLYLNQNFTESDIPLLFLRSKKYTTITSKGNTSKIRLKTVTGYMGNQCFGVPLMNADSFYANLVSFCQQTQVVKTSVCSELKKMAAENLTYESSQAVNSASQTQGLNVKNKFKINILLLQKHLDVEQRGTSNLSFSKNSDFGVSISALHELDEDKLINSNIRYYHFNLRDASTALNQFEFSNLLTFHQEFDNYKTYINLGLGLNQVPSLYIGACEIGCTTTTSVDYEAGAGVKFVFLQFDWRIGFSIAKALFTDSRLSVSNDYRYKLLTDQKWHLNKKSSLFTEFIYDSIYRSVSNGTTSSVFEQKSHSISAGVGFEWVFE